MSQSGFIAACLLGGFVLWLAINGKLSAYSKILFGSAAPANNGGSNGGLFGSLKGAAIKGVENAILPGAGEVIGLPQG